MLDAFEEQTALYKALAHPVRLAILEILRDGEECVCHMEAILGLRQAYISQQLMVLRDVGLVDNRKDGWNNFYYIVHPEIFALFEAASSVLGIPSGENEEATEWAHQPADCSCPKCSDG